MKKRGVTFIETIIAITIFLIGIIPIAQLTLNSLRQLKRASEIEEGARIASVVINYIKSRGYTVISEGETFSTKTSDITWDDNTFFKSYELTSSDGSYVSTDFEDDFYGDIDLGDGIFFIENLGIDLNGATIEIAMEKANLQLAEFDSANEVYNTLNYTNPISTSSSSVLIGTGGLMEDPIIYGLVKVAYQSKSTTDSNKIDKEYEQTFVVTPIENF